MSNYKCLSTKNDYLIVIPVDNNCLDILRHLVILPGKLLRLNPSPHVIHYDAMNLQKKKKSKCLSAFIKAIKNLIGSNLHQHFALIIIQYIYIFF